MLFKITKIEKQKAKTVKINVAKKTKMEKHLNIYISNNVSNKQEKITKLKGSS